ncbi:hypothetical protein TWF730_003748 [Orbilia blumenaviensis]|uniref:ATP-grasp domain-containing protein n=1 Tax=Orbilia blumenaviensis TaxID=1796055 RepID=A0AAV9U371_9PEZI
MAKAVISYPRHVFNNVSLLFLCILFSPVVLLVSTLAYGLGKLWSRKAKLPTLTSRRTVLITCPERMTKSLTLCRAFHEAGHRVIAAEGSPRYAYECSNSVSKYYTIPSPTDPAYVTTLADIIKRESVDLLVPVCGVQTTLEDVKAAEELQKSLGCRMFQLNTETCELLDKKNSFIAKARELGLTVPETYEFSNKEEMLKFLESSMGSGKKYILKCIALDDTSRSRIPLLPLAENTSTRAALENIPISENNPFILQQYVEGQEFTTHAVITHGKVRAFAACQSSELTMHYKPLPLQSGLSQAMLEFTEKFATSLPGNQPAQLSFDFIVPLQLPGVDYSNYQKDQITLYPIECNPRTHTAIVMFQDQLKELGDAYMSIFEDSESSEDSEILGPGPLVKGRYWIGHDIFSLVILPFLNLILLQETPSGFLKKFVSAVSHILFWKDGVLSAWDPLPFFMLYTVHWPRKFLISLWTGKRWTRVNVSTSRAFDAHVR